MKILFFIPYVPNLVRVRPYNLIRSIARLGHQVTLAAIVSDDSEVADLEKLRPFCQEVLFTRLPKWQSLMNVSLTLPSSRPLQASYCWKPSFARVVAEHIDQQTEKQARNKGQAYDVIHVEHLRGSRYGLALLRKGEQNPARPPVIWDSVDCISYLFRQAASKSKNRLSRLWTGFELKRTERYESLLAKKFASVLVTSPVDRDAFLSLPGIDPQNAPIRVLPNGVDLEYFKPGNENREPATLVISGKMSYHANVTMTLYLLQNIMPRIWSRKPDVRVVVVGKDPPREIMSLANPPFVEVTGTVKDVSSYLQRSTVAVAPIQYGAGIQNKVLEAMATATPVVTTPQAIAALSVKPDRELLVASDPDTFAEKVLFLLDHPDESRRIGRAGRVYVEEHFRWDQIAMQLEGIYREVSGCRS